MLTEASRYIKRVLREMRRERDKLTVTENEFTGKEKRAVSWAPRVSEWHQTALHALSKLLRESGTDQEHFVPDDRMNISKHPRESQ